MVREYKGAFSGEHGDGLVRTEWVGWQFGPRLARAFEEIKDLFDPAGLMNPGKIVRGTKMDDASLFRFRSGPPHAAAATALDWSAWNVQNDALTGALTPPGTGGDPAGGFGKAVEMCNNNGHCRKFDAGTMCPSYRATRDEQHSTRGRANTLRLALSGRARCRRARLRRGARRARSLRELQGLPARMPDRRRHGEDEDRGAATTGSARTGCRCAPALIAHLPRWAPWAARLPWLANLRDTLPGAARLERGVAGLLRATRAAGMAARHVPARRGGASRARRMSASADVVLFVDTFTNYFEPENARAAVERAARRRLPRARGAGGRRRRGAGAAAVLRPNLSRRRPRRRGEARGAPRRRRARCRTSSAAPRSSASSRRACCRCATSSWCWAWAMPRSAWRSSAFLVEEFLAREHRAGRLALRLAALPQTRALLHRALPPEGVRRGGARSRGAGPRPGPRRRAGRVELLRDGGQLRLRRRALRRVGAGWPSWRCCRPCVRRRPDTLIVADGTSCRHQIADLTRGSRPARGDPRRSACSSARSRNREPRRGSRGPETALLHSRPALAYYDIGISFAVPRPPDRREAAPQPKRSRR